MPPWEKYQQQAPQSERATPWRRYAAARAAEPEQQPEPALPPSRRGQSAPLMQEAEGALASINRGNPFAQDVSGIARGVMAASQTAATPGTSLQDILQSGIGGYQAQIQRGRGMSQDFAARRPNVAALAEGTGTAIGVLPALATGGAAAPASTLRGLPLFGRQMAQGAATGAAYGAVYGAGTGDAPGQPLEQRLQAANEMAAMGGALGTVTPAAVNALGAGVGALRPAWQALANPRPIATQAAESGAGVFGGQGFGNVRRLPQRPPPAPPAANPQAVATIDRLRDRARMTPDEVERAFAEARRNPQGQVVADVFGDPGVRTTRALAQGPGQTGQRAADVARERFQAAPDRILTELNRRLAVAETPEQALQSLNQQYQEASATLYRPLFERPMGAAQRQRLETAINKIGNVPQVRRAMAQADDLFNGERELGLVEGQVDDNFARWAHYLKMAVDDVIGAGRRDGSLAANQLRIASTARRQLLDAMDEAIPGYREARSRWSTISSAEEALGEGRTLITQNASFIRSRMGEMTDFERYHARVGFANEVASRIGLRGSVNGNRNVAEALGSPEMQRRVAAMFDSPEEAAAFLDTLNQQNMLMRNAAQWGTGSQTYSNALHGADEALHTFAEMGGQAAGGNLMGALRRGGQGAINTLTAGAVERANNVRGETLLRRVDTEDAATFAKAVVDELRRREAARAARSRATRTGAAAAAAGQDRR